MRILWGLVALLVVSAGCGDDGGPGTNDAGTSSRTDAAADGGPAIGVDGGMDAALDASTDAAIDAGTDAAVDANMDAATDSGADAGPRYVFSGRATWISHAALGGVETVDRFDNDGTEGTDGCCFDLNGDSEIDNAWGDLVSGLSGLFGNGAQADLAESLECGESVVLFEFVGLDDATDDATLTVNSFNGRDVAGGAAYGECRDEPRDLSQFEHNLSGDGVFEVGSDGFVGDPLRARHSAAGAISSSVLSTSPSTITVGLPLMGTILDVPVTNARIEAATGTSSGGLLDLSLGKLGGAVPVDSIHAAINAYMETDCSCLGLDAPLVRTGIGPRVCNRAEPSGITCSEDEATCQQVHDFCSVLLATLRPDVDTDSDAENDALSVGLWFEGKATALQFGAGVGMPDGGMPDGGVPDAGPCPVAMGTIAEGTAVTPGTVLHLSGSSDVTASRFEWRVTAPTGSVSTFMPSAAAADPTFEAAVVGDYVFELDVWNTDGTRSCAPWSETVHVVPSTGIYVQLTWDTPGDPDQADEGPEAGADLDLHFAHELAAGPDVDMDGLPDPYFAAPFDCFWLNASPDWGAVGVGGDPRLVDDDSDGAGPEAVHVASPEDGRTYTVGVHYWHDHGFGPSSATIRVFIDGTPVYEATDVELVDRDMWSVATIDWPSGAVTPITRSGGGYKIIASYESPLAPAR